MVIECKSIEILFFFPSQNFTQCLLAYKSLAFFRGKLCVILQKVLFPCETLSSHATVLHSFKKLCICSHDYCVSMKIFAFAHTSFVSKLAFCHKYCNREKSLHSRASFAFSSKTLHSPCERKLVLQAKVLK